MRNAAHDCGARNVNRLRPIVSTYAQDAGRLDALFVSHLDGDHVDGLDTLLATLSPKDVYLPYLDIVDRLVGVMEAEQEGRLTATLEQALLDPVGWFGERGAENVIFVRNDGDVPEGGFAPPDVPGDHDPADDRPTVLERLGAEPAADRDAGKALRGNVERPTVLEMKIGGCLVATKGAGAEWLLVPFVPRVDPAISDAFRARVRVAVGLSPDAPISAAILQKQLKTSPGRERLRECYEEILDGGATTNHNKVSMSLYSGPAGSSGLRRVAHQRRHRLAEVWWGVRLRSDATGWIGTGDAKLKTKWRRREWADFYQHVSALIGTFVLPHHGSKANWHRDLLDATGADLFVASSDDPSTGYEHPSESVILDIERDDTRMLTVVSGATGTRLVERVDPH